MTDLNIHDGGEIARFLQVVEAFILHQLTDDLIRNLVAPLVDYRHVDVINEHGHFLPSWRTIHAAHTLVYVTLDGPLHSHKNI